MLNETYCGKPITAIVPALQGAVPPEPVPQPTEGVSIGAEINELRGGLELDT